MSRERGFIKGVYRIRFPIIAIKDINNNEIDRIAHDLNQVKDSI